MVNELEAISPIDGRYRNDTQPLQNFSEKGLINYRTLVESEYLIALSEYSGLGPRELSDDEKEFVRNLYTDFSLEDAQFVKKIEKTNHGIEYINNGKKTEHDVKAVEYFIKDKLRNTPLQDSSEWVHFALTSEDITNLSYGLMLGDGIVEVILPKAGELYEKINWFSEKYKDVPILGRTHGQPASPTTFGKEFKVYASRLKNQLEQLKNYELLVKLNGATGNYNAHHAAYPDVDWINFTRDFVEKLNEKSKIKLKPNLITTQIESHDTYAELFDNMKRLNNILIDFNQDVWRYISDGWIIQRPIEGEVGSSTMPHKVNPINFENSEGNLGMANALFEFFSRELPKSRLQRDLSDSTIERNFGVSLGYCLIAYNSTLRGLNKIVVDETKVIEELENHPEIISEAFQTILKREGAEMPYERLKELTRGRKVDMNDFRRFIEELKVSDQVKAELKQITPINYTGLARDLVEVY
ncbi:MAG: adenylosuccinate lyase [Candidatus Aenigmarchaeota archaeon]|nr:adenylosuccinate lyase [Candidatus Aenigmarchaeota archaeon]